MSLVPTALLCLAVLSAQAQNPDPQRAEAERLALAGDHARALKQFQSIAAANPDDIPARMWIARLHGLMGHPERAADVYESIVATDARNVEALVGLGNSLVSIGRLQQASDALTRAEAIAADQPSVLSAQGALHRAAGRSTLALAYYQRALALDPGNTATREAYDAMRAARAHRIEGTYYHEVLNDDAPDTKAGFLELNARVTDTFRLFGDGQFQRKFGMDENRGGGGFEWLPNGRVHVRAGAMFGNDTVILPDGEATLDASYQGARVGLLGTIRYLHFENASSVIVSPGVTFSPVGGLLIAVRYYRSQLDFTGGLDGIEGEANDGVSVGAGFKLGRRVSAGVKYARGYESLPVITLERIAEFDMNTVSAGIKVDAAPMTSFGATYQHEWRLADVRVSSLFVNLTQRF